MTHHTFLVRGLAMVLLPALAASQALAGPPLLCHPFDPGTAAVLPWGPGPGWKSPSPGYDRARLVADTLRVLSPDAPVIARMENLRRATIYAAGDRQAAADLMAALLARTRTATGGESRDAMAWFDAGFLIETYREAFQVFQWGMLDAAERRAWAMTAAPAMDGLAMVRKAMALAPGHYVMAQAESLIVQGKEAGDRR